MLRVLLLVVTVQAALLADFRAAVVKVDITPTDPQPLLGYQAHTSTGVHDPLSLRLRRLLPQTQSRYRHRRLKRCPASTSLFQAIYISNSENYVILNPNLAR